jgi:hypothetical protein
MASMKETKELEAAWKAGLLGDVPFSHVIRTWNRKVKEFENEGK